MGSQVRNICYFWRDESRGEADSCHIFIVIALLYPCAAYPNFTMFLSVPSSGVFHKPILVKFFVVLLGAHFVPL